MLRDAAVRHPPAAVLSLPDLGEALVGLKRVAAVGDEVQRRVERLPVKARIGGGIRDLVEEVRRREGLRASHAEDVLGQHVERAFARHRRVLHSRGGGHDRGTALQHFEAVRRHQDGARGFVEPVIGAADPLNEPARPFRSADVDAEIDIAPVDAKIERRGRDHRLQGAGRHRGFDLAALSDVERAVVQGNGQVVGVGAPEVPEKLLGLEPRVDEEKGELRGLDGRVDLADGVAGAVASPGEALGRVQHGDVRRRALGCHDHRGRPLTLTGEVAAEFGGLAHRRR